MGMNKIKELCGLNHRLLIFSLSFKGFLID